MLSVKSRLDAELQSWWVLGGTELHFHVLALHRLKAHSLVTALQAPNWRGP